MAVMMSIGISKVKDPAHGKNIYMASDCQPDFHQKIYQARQNIFATK